MEADWSEQAKKDMKPFEKALQGFFLSHIDKLCKMPPRRHLKHGLPFFVEDVTKNARFVYVEDGSTLWIMRCFATHKEYERWYNSYR